MNPATDLRIDLITAPLHCCFVECPGVWHRELSRLIPPNRQVLFRDMASDPDLASQLPHRSFVLLGVSIVDLATLRTIHDLTCNSHRVVAVGSRALRTQALTLRMAGAVGIVTDICECDKVAQMIEAAARLQGKTPGSWKTRFVNRLPWNPV